MNGEPALGIIDKTEIFASFLNRYDIHEASRVGGVGSDFAVDFDEALHHDGFGLTTVESILQSIGWISHSIIFCLQRARPYQRLTDSE